MSVSHPQKNGLLLLLQAAKKLDEEETLHRYSHSTDKWEHRSQRNYDETHSSYSCPHSYSSQKRPVTSVRCTHNELEKSRRAHLRTCMETLREHLNFDNDVPRITMLTVLKKATATIQLLKQKKQCLEVYEDSEKQRCVQLLKRRQALRKKLEEKRSRSLKLQSWKERNRNCSECSIATTSSGKIYFIERLYNGSYDTKILSYFFTDDSEMDLRSGSLSNITAQSLNNNTQLSNTAAAGLNTCVNDPNFVLHISKHRSLSSPIGTISSSPVGLDAFDASSSDSGFEEITISSNGVVSPNENSLTYCTNDRSQCVSAYSNKVCRAC
ncbi:putative max binding protein, mnt [Schistosoma mansoni]|uniref:putative max binding protein, mnt n=1 Tax=Schistosoma mansoni TaxID=6183 RepID=UPI0001A635AB|nr:putative max binding protein, mnt [Schistosoma mansoni]|eukprot:XP_018651184.1 putative max binding protein, mnt [Schistosoma mansoni]